jgi:uncharacterized membrane protein
MVNTISSFSVFSVVSVVSAVQIPTRHQRFIRPLIEPKAKSIAADHILDGIEDGRNSKRKCSAQDVVDSQAE